MSYPTQILYATVADLREVLDATDAGTGTAAQLTDQQLTMALFDASSELSVFAGAVYDSSSAPYDPPPMFHNLTLSLAAFYATVNYLKHKELAPTHPVYLRYQRAVTILDDVRDGKLQLDAGIAGDIGQETGTVINRIPPVFTGEDSNTRLNPYTGTLESDVPFGQWAPRGDDFLGGQVYQG